MLLRPKITISLFAVFIFLFAFFNQIQSQQNSPNVISGKIPAPETGKLYHGIHIGGKEGEEDIIFTKPETIKDYIDITGTNHKPFFIYFSQEWGEEGRNKPDFRKFPITAIRAVTSKGAVPFIRLMLRSSSDSLENCKTVDCREKYYSLENIIGWDNNKIDKIDAGRRQIHDEITKNLQNWAVEARKYPGPLIIEFGTEVNNHLFHLNAKHNLADREKAAALFRKAYRHIVKIISGDEPEKSNITWVFHVTADSDPKELWNDMANYFPDGTSEDSRNYVDWVGVSVYGATDLEEKSCEKFSTQFQRALDENGLLALSKRGKERPIFVLEFGTAINYPDDGEKQCQADVWTKEAFATMLDFAQKGKLAGFSWWSENFEDDSGKKHKLKMRVKDFNRKLKKAYLEAISNRKILHSTPLFAVSTSHM
jgi:hypothetical protein